MDDSEVSTYCNEGEQIELCMQVFHCRGLCLTAADGPGDYGAMLQLLEQCSHATAIYVGMLHFHRFGLREVAFKLLLKGLGEAGEAEAALFLGRALASGNLELQSQAAMAIARRFTQNSTFPRLPSGASDSEASLFNDLLGHLARWTPLPKRPAPRESKQLQFVNDPLVMAQRTLGCYLKTARRLKPGWMYRTVIECTDLTDSLASMNAPPELPQVAAERGISVDELQRCLEITWVNKSGIFLGLTSCKQMFLAATWPNCVKVFSITVAMYLEVPRSAYAA